MRGIKRWSWSSSFSPLPRRERTSNCESFQNSHPAVLQTDPEGSSCSGLCAKEFRQFLYRRCFILVTDHKPLVAMFGPMKGTTMGSNRLARWALLLSHYDYTQLNAEKLHTMATQMH